MLRQHGLALGGSLENAIVLGETGVLNNALRFEDEFVRHKILDAIGDLALVGYPVIGHLVAHRAGHALHTAFAAKILEETDAWRLVEAPSTASCRCRSPSRAPRAAAGELTSLGPDATRIADRARESVTLARLMAGAPMPKPRPESHVAVCVSTRVRMLLRPSRSLPTRASGTCAYRHLAVTVVLAEAVKSRGSGRPRTIGGGGSTARRVAVTWAAT